MESATARTTNHDNKLVYFGRKVIFFFKLYNYSNKKGRLRMKENKNTCTRKKLSNKKMKIIYITLLLALLVELIIIILIMFNRAQEGLIT